MYGIEINIVNFVFRIISFIHHLHLLQQKTYASDWLNNNMSLHSIRLKDINEEKIPGF